MLESGAPTDVVWSGMWMEIVVTLIPVIVGIGMMLLRTYANKLMKRIDANDAEKEAVQCLLEGMASAQEEIVRDAKKKAADGKLTKTEIEAAKKHAIAHALTVAKGPALDVLKTMGTNRMGSLIKQLLAKLTKKEK
jgi:hypothetical protein